VLLVYTTRLSEQIGPDRIGHLDYPGNERRTQGFSPIQYLLPRELKTATKWGNRAFTELIITHPHEDHINDIETIKKTCSPALLTRQRYNWDDVKVSEDGEYKKLDIYAAWQNTYNATPVEFPSMEWTSRRLVSRLMRLRR